MQESFRETFKFDAWLFLSKIAQKFQWKKLQVSMKKPSLKNL